MLVSFLNSVARVVFELQKVMIRGIYNEEKMGRGGESRYIRFKAQVVYSVL